MELFHKLEKHCQIPIERYKKEPFILFKTKGYGETHGLTAGSTETWRWDMTWPSDCDSHTIRVVVDAEGDITESNEGNNERSEAFSAICPKNPPIASASDITGQPKIMYPDTLYQVTAKYYDPDGRTNLYLCSLGLTHHPTADDIVVGWSQDLDMPIEDSPYITFLDVDSTPITGTYEGYQLTWKFKISDTWPEAKDCIDFGVVNANREPRQ